VSINYISKLEFFCVFREVFFISITEKNIQSGFAGASLIPYDPDRVISKPNIQLRTPTPARPPDPATHWVSKTPQNPIETSLQTEFIKNRITNHQNSSLILMLQAVDQFAKGATAIIHQIAFLRGEIETLHKANEGLSKRRRAKKTRVRLRGTLTVQDTENILDQRDMDEQIA
jgi:hypothetical protein